MLGAWNGTSDLVSLPNATLVMEQGGRYRWQETTAEVRALQSADGSFRRAATLYWRPKRGPREILEAIFLWIKEHERAVERALG